MPETSPYAENSKAVKHRKSKGVVGADKNTESPGETDRDSYIAADWNQLYLNMMLSKSNGYSMMPVVGTRTRRISCSVGR